MRAWIARDKDKQGFIFFGEKPTKDFLCKCWNNSNFDYRHISEDKMPEGVNPKWSDDEPVEVEITIAKVQEE